MRVEGETVNKRKIKRLFRETEFIQFNTAFWTADDACFIHPRNRVQVPFAILVFCWTGARIGAFFPNSKEGTKGLLYKVQLYPANAKPQVNH